MCNFSVSSYPSRTGFLFFLPCGRSCTVFMRLLHNQLSAVRICFPPHPAVVLLRIEAKGSLVRLVPLEGSFGWDLRKILLPIKGWDMNGLGGRSFNIWGSKNPYSQGYYFCKKTLKYPKKNCPDSVKQSPFGLRPPWPFLRISRRRSVFPLRGGRQRPFARAGTSSCTR